MKKIIKQYIFAVLFVPIITIQVGIDKLGCWLIEISEKLESWYTKLGDKIFIKFIDK